MIALGLLLLVVAAVVALVGIFTNLGSSHQLGRTVDLLGYHLHGSTGKLLLVGVIVGAVGMLGLNMLLAGIGRGFSRSISKRKERRSQRQVTQTVVQDRDHLASELEREHAARVHAERQWAAAKEERVAVIEPAQPQLVRRETDDATAREGTDSRSSSIEPGAVRRRDM
ncbi:MAG: hypothetical protein JWN96_2286 [Mycobacterium sp.]|nr:hypothetical protein [Mycobacterium sp.]